MVGSCSQRVAFAVVKNGGRRAHTAKSIQRLSGVERRELTTTSIGGRRRQRDETAQSSLFLKAPTSATKSVDGEKAWHVRHASGQQWFSTAGKKTEEEEGEKSKTSEDKQDNNDKPDDNNTDEANGGKESDAKDKEAQESIEAEESRFSSASAGDAATNVLQSLQTFASNFRTGLAETWQELLDSGRPRSINKSIRTTNPNPSSSSSSTGGDGIDHEAADKYQGTTSLMLVDEELSAWEKMQRRLAEAPIIQNILGASHEVFEKTGAKAAKRKLDDIRHDASEAWETSQNPWVYRLSSVWDTVTAETEFALATKELRRLDPSFTLEAFKSDVMATVVPDLMKYLLEGRTKELKPWLGEAVYNRLAAEIRVRKQEGLVIDPHILGMENAEIIAAEMDENNKGSPIILLHFMCQQINCVRKKDGTIVEGGEDEIRANSYIVAMQREYNDEEGSLHWKIIDFRFNGGIAWI